MHPDRRREGRAIRKQRRLEREKGLDALPQLIEFLASLPRMVGEAFEALGKSMSEVGRSIQGIPPTIPPALLPSPGALRLSEGGSLSPTHSEVEALRSSRSASGSERVREAEEALGLNLLPWQREVAEIYLDGGRLHLARGRSVGRTVVQRVIEHAERDPQAEQVDHGGWEDH